MSSFALNFKKFKDLTEKQLDNVVRKTSFDLYKEIINKSPVDTGRFRGANMISVDSVDNTAPANIRSQSAQLNEAKSTLSGKVAGHIVFISNNLTYAVDLEYGKSKQAPKGIYGVSVMKFNRFLENAVKESK